MQVDTPCAHLGQQMDNLDRRQRGAHGIAKRVAPAIGNGPETKAKFVLGLGLIICHTFLLQR